jgi:4-hydroxybenzoate polyprenyltransferase
VSYVNGLVIELGRKLRAPEDEEAGVETYTALWGRPNAVAAWLGVMAATGALALQAARLIRFQGLVAAALGAAFVVSGALAADFLRDPRPGRGRRFEAASGLWTVCLYLSLGVVPLAVAAAGRAP